MVACFTFGPTESVNGRLIVNECSRIRVVANDVEFHFPTAMAKPSNFGVAFDEIALPIQIFSDKCFEVGHIMFRHQ